MIPVLYPANQVLFFDNGLGGLSDTVSCLCTEILNDSYELELSIPIDGAHASQIAVNRIIKAKPNYIDDPQPFRIYSVTKNDDGLVNVKAAHLSYDTNGIPVLPFTSETLEDSVQNINQNTVSDSLFEVSSDFLADGDMKVEVPTSLKALLGGSDKSLLGIYGGYFHYDWYSIELLEARGVNKGICFRSNKNVSEFEQETNSEEQYSEVFGYWKKDEDTLVYSDTIAIGQSLAYEKTLILEVSSEALGISDHDTPTEDQLNEYVQSYIETNRPGSPKYSMSITYKDDVEITKINLGDVVGVLLPEYGIRLTARCNKVVFDSLLEQNESIEIGDVDAGLPGEIASLSE